ncbi:MAG: class I SAM-dependent methyltransferase [Solirubrobacterales bacterium]
MPKFADSLSRRAMFNVLDRIDDGRLELVEPAATRSFGQTKIESPLTSRVEVHHPHFYTSFFRGSLGLAESYIDGEWDTDDLTAFVRVGARNMPALDRARGFYRLAEKPVRTIGALLHDEHLHKRKTARHYNLGNDLYERMLDKTMAYSSAIFTSPDDTLEAAQTEKFDRVCRSLQLTPRDHLIEIGSGWGGFAIHAAEKYGCRVTSATIAGEQTKLARRRIREAGLDNRIEIVECDFAKLEGTYDKLVSIEMIETIGWRRFDEFFRVCNRLLKPDGRMCHQIITIDDRAYEAEKMSRSFANTLIFPGGSLPSNEFISKAIARETEMQLLEFEDITAHYPETLRRWRSNFNESFEELRARGYDERFHRLWNLYLAYCEAGFVERRILVGQATYAKPTHRDTWDSFATSGEAGNDVRSSV